MDQNQNLPSAGATRREFIKKTATAAAVVASASALRTPIYGQNQAPSANVKGANDRLVLGFVGLGGQGFNAHVRGAKEHESANNVALAAVCDVSKTRVDKAKEFIGGNCEGFSDYRKLLERKDLDAVFCATIDPWHAPVSIDSMKAGKHIYVEKPMTRYLGEAFDIYDTVKSTGKILQVGSQGCSDQKWHKAAEWIKADKIGQVVMLQGSYMRNSPKGEWNYKIEDWCTAEDVDWKQWIARVNKKIDFSADHYFRWRKYYPYCSGLLGDLFPHKLHPYMLATGNPQFPTRVSAIGSKLIHTDKNTQGTPERDVPEIIQLIAEFPNGMLMHITSSTVNELGTQEVIRGHKGNLNMQGNRVLLTPERPFTEEVDGDSVEGLAGEDVPLHHKNWFDSIRANKQPNANIDLATKVQTVISLAEMSDRLGTVCFFDEKTRKVTDGAGKPITPITYGTLPLS